MYTLPPPSVPALIPVVTAPPSVSSPPSLPSPSSVKKIKKNARKSSGKSQKQPKFKKVKEVSNADIARGTLVDFHRRLVDENISLPAPTTLTLPLELLENDFTIRSLSQTNIDVLHEQMAGGLWQHELCTFVVHKPKAADKYFIIDGNHRFLALARYNAQVEASMRLLNVKCKVFAELDFNQILLATSPVFTPLPHANLTVLQKLRLVRMALSTNGLPLAMASKKDQELYRPIMEIYFSTNYPDACTHLLMLSETIVDNLFAVRCGDIPLEQIDLSPDFWKTFCSAAKKNMNGSLQILTLLGEKSVKQVVKLLKNVPVDLLAFMSERGPHEYDTEEAAMEYLTDGIVTNKETLLNHFRKMDLDHNKARDAGVYDWVVVKERLKSHIRQYSSFPNAQFSSSITDPMLHESDVVISQNATVCSLCVNKIQQTLQVHFLQKVEIFCKKAVVILIGNYGENAPTLPNSTPIAVFDIVTENPLFIEKEFTTLLTTSVKASLYLPGAPLNDNLAKMKFLSNRAMEKKCCLGTIMTLKNSHTLAYFADFYDNALFCNTNLKITTHFLNTLSCFSKIIVSGEKELQELISTTTKPIPTDSDSEEE